MTGRPIVQDPEMWQRYRQILESWLGTPYRHCAVLKGRGADCTLFLGGVLQELGVLRRLVYTYYPCDWYEHADDDRLVDALYQHFADHCVEQYEIILLQPAETEPMVGDILAFSTERNGISNHVGVYYRRRQMIHCVPRRGVITYQYGDCWARRLRQIFRIVEVQ